jgi:hypothetical protein
MVPLISGHLAVGIYDVVNIKKAKKQVMKYPWYEETLFFQDVEYLGMQSGEC